MQIHQAQPNELAQIMTIEHAGFTPDEAATEAAMRDRIVQIPDTFLVAEQNGQVTGYVVGPALTQRYITDDLFKTLTPNETSAPYLAILSLAVAPSAQGQGVGGQLLTAFAARARDQGRQAITLTCLKRLIPFYEAHGYVNEGIADSAHAGEVWYNMVQTL
ncbi:GNAT family N-acetyltransferase [Lacticaseibacillus pabuli]|uniref:GNAT family N-acetyltransferase n=1 Tax=Lacticaseibacillus pabuli TaxID=3025672 RepID=A0ABY7WNX4_9LACO|nr:GNAT family N-acetyltransferase [Lacticaseibacillus sp. KACC 23028]WDF81902.1 GNAT family N-acetyltransferase [Lacticaseibacillus sp. KACC 23028]